MTALYNDNHPFVGHWLEELIAHDLIAPGTIDRRSITELRAGDVAGHGQRHFFAGLGGWSYALRFAGVPDDADIWTGSCPCQPLSDAGQGRGFSDPRHLWPAWFALIQECRPPVIFGEQVASRLGLEWLDLVFADLERCGYTVGAADLCAAGVGAPHARQRLYFVAYTHSEPGRLHLRPRGSREAHPQVGRGSEDSGLADATGERRISRKGVVPSRAEQPDPARSGPSGRVAHAARSQRVGRGQRAPHRRETVESPGRSVDGVADSDGARLGVEREQQARRQRPSSKRGRSPRIVGDTSGPGGGRHAGGVPGAETANQPQGHPGRRVPDIAIPAGATRGFWHPADWILCRDPSGGPPVARAVEPGTFPLAHGVPDRVGLLSGYGNAIVPQVAAAFIRAALASIADLTNADLATGKPDVHDGPTTR